MTLTETLQKLIETPSDINEHLPTLKAYAEKCDHVTEMGVRWIVSTYAFLAGNPKRLVSIDMQHPSAWGADISVPIQFAQEIGCDFSFVKANTLEVEIEPTDMLFIDTWHAYKQLKAELALHQSRVAKYIVLHDTTTYGEYDETSYEAMGPDWKGEGIGLWRAVTEFLNEFPEWTIEERFTNNNGLTVLRRN